MSALKTRPANLFLLVALLLDFRGNPARADEELIEPLPDIPLIERIVISADCQHYLMSVVQQLPKSPFRRIFLDGKVIDGPRADSMAISPNGKHTATPYLLREEVGTEDISGDPLFSPDSRRLAAVTHREKDWQLVVDGVTVGPPSEIAVSQLVFSPDSHHLAYVIGKEGHKRVQRDNRLADDTYLDVRDLQFSRNGKHLAFLASTVKDQWTVVIDGVSKTEQCTSISRFRFSADGEHWGCFIRRVAEVKDEPCAVIIDGKAFWSVNEHGMAPIFSDDGKLVTAQVTHSAGRNAHNEPSFHFISIIDGQLKEPSSRLQEVAYSPDGQRSASIAWTNQSFSLGPVNPRYVPLLKIDGQVSNADAIYFGGLRFSPDGKRLAYEIRGKGLCQIGLLPKS